MLENRIILTSDQRKELEKFTKTGVHSARLIKRATIILLLDTSEGRKAVKWNDISLRENVSGPTINVVRRDFQKAEFVSDFLQRKKRHTPPIEPKVTGEVESRIIALACSPVPDGYSRWTVRMLANKSVEIGLIDSISYTTVSRLLKKHHFSLT
jgi:hypothetical protein